jgi:hypothetical protein
LLSLAVSTAVLSLAVAASASATTYYVDSGTAGSDTNAGTSATVPWKTLSKVQAATLGAGDSVLFRRGASWTGTLAIAGSGTATSPITLGSYGVGGERPSFTYDCSTGHTTGQVFSIAGDYVTVDSLLFQDTTPCYGTGNHLDTSSDYYNGGAVYLQPGSDHDVVTNSEFNNVGIGVRIRGDYATVSHNYIHDLHLVVPNNAGDLGSYGAMGVSIGGSHALVSYNRFERCRGARGTGTGPNDYDGGSVEIEGASYSSSKVLTDITIDHNSSYDSEQFGEVDISTTGDVHVTNNYSNDYGVFWGWSTDFDFVPQPGWEFTNNTVIKRHAAENIPVFNFWYNPPTGVSPWWHYADNVFLINGAQQISPQLDAPHDHNVYWRLDGASTASALLGGGASLGTGDVIADPELLDASDTDGHLAPTSPAIGLGAGSGLGADAGAFPYAGSAQPNMLIDGGFEDQSAGGTLQLPWKRDEGNGNWGVDNHVAGKPYSGSNNAWIAYDSSMGTGWTDLAQPQVPVRPSTTYTFSCYTRDSGTIGNGWIGEYSTASKTLGTKTETMFAASTSYTLRSVSFTTGASTTWVTPYVGYDVASGTWMQVDACVLKATDTTVSLGDGDFESQTSSSIASPWRRDEGTGTVSVDYHAGTAFSGLNDARIATASGWTSLAQGPITVQPDTFYRFTCEAESSSNMPAGYLGAYWTTSRTTGTKNEISFPAATSYTRRTVLVDGNANTTLTPYVGYAGNVAGSWLAADACTLARG